MSYELVFQYFQFAAGSFCHGNSDNTRPVKTEIDIQIVAGLFNGDGRHQYQDNRKGELNDDEDFPEAAAHRLCCA